MKNRLLRQDFRKIRNAANRAVFLFLFFVGFAVVFALTGCTSGDKEPENASEKNAAENAPSAFEEFSYVYPEWRDREVFMHISEYFSGNENTGGDVIVRSTPVVREGMYFQIGMPFRVVLPEGATLKIEYLRGDNRDIQVQTFTLPATSKNPFSEILAGLTGTHWPFKNRVRHPASRTGFSDDEDTVGDRIRLVAWRVTLNSPDGRVWQKQSFLWKLPDVPAKS